LLDFANFFKNPFHPARQSPQSKKINRKIPKKKTREKIPRGNRFLEKSKIQQAIIQKSHQSQVRGFYCSLK